MACGHSNLCRRRVARAHSGITWPAYVHDWADLLAQEEADQEQRAGEQREATPHSAAAVLDRDCTHGGGDLLARAVSAGVSAARTHGDGSRCRSRQAPRYGPCLTTLMSAGMGLQA